MLWKRRGVWGAPFQICEVCCPGIATSPCCEAQSAEMCARNTWVTWDGLWETKGAKRKTFAMIQNPTYINNTYIYIYTSYIYIQWCWEWLFSWIFLFDPVGLSFPQVLARFPGSWVAAGSMDWLKGKGKGKSDGGHLASESNDSPWWGCSSDVFSLQLAQCPFMIHGNLWPI